MQPRNERVIDMNTTTNKRELDAITLLDSNWRMRDSLLRGWFINNIDALRFYDFGARMSRVPIGGCLLKKTLNLYYRYIHTNSLIFSLQDIEEIIGNASDIYVDPCPCRLIANKDTCEAPLFCCMRINHSAEVRKAQNDSQGIGKKDAIAIMRNARKYGLVFSLESCIQPYQYNICTCCPDCCIGMRMRYEYGLDVFHSGPYAPEFGAGNCRECVTCAEVCPVNAISLVDSRPVVDLGRCLGCGLCSEKCSRNSISMVIEETRIRKDVEPGRIRLFLSLLVLYLVMIPSIVIYRIFVGSRKHEGINVKPMASDYFDHTMQ